MKNLQILKSCTVTNLTFGSSLAFPAHRGEIFEFDRLIEKNESYAVVQSGMNYYIFEACAVEVLGA